MKYLSKIILFFAFSSLLMVACKKESALPTYSSGNAAVLSSSKATIAAAPADSSTTVVTFSWTDPMYATSASSVKYVLEIDSTGRNFAKSISYTLTGAMSKSLTGKELNDILLGFGFNFNVAYGIDLRVTSSYANNNDIKVSNTLKVTATPYKVPPKVALPTSNRLFIVGGASTFGWSNSSTINPAEEFARLDETTWAGVFYFAGGDEYLILPVKGDWSNKFSLQDKNVSGISAGGDFGFNFNDNFKAPTAGGWYKITMDFQRGKFTVEPFNGPQLPTDLFMVGDATPASWSNPATGPTVQPLTRMNSCVWKMSSIVITAGKEYLVLPVAGSWSNKYSVADKTVAGLSAGGTFGYNLNDNFPGPAIGGNYKIELNFATAKFKTTKL